MNAAKRTKLLRLRRKLLRWHDEQNERDFSWRHEVRKPYEVWLCEMMGQQTQATRIEQYLHRFIGTFPSVHALAKANRGDVIKAWQGLGYNRRALQIHRAATLIVECHGGKLPTNEVDLRSLPGIGPYTARAILVFAFGKPVSAVDVNVSRVLSRISKRVRSTAELLPISTVTSINEEVLPRTRNREWHEALMDLGATVCTKNHPKCASCPLKDGCPSSSLHRSVRPRLHAVAAEKRYHGHPKRIWRGRVLKLIAAGPKSRRMLCSVFMRDHGLTRSDAGDILSLVLPSLIKEQFIRLHNGKYRLD